MSSLPLGSLNFGTACVLAQYLLPGGPSEQLAAYVRVVDKYSINPPTTYVPKDFLQFVNERKDVFEYKQANLINPGKFSYFHRETHHVGPNTAYQMLSRNALHLPPMAVHLHTSSISPEATR